jgi:hypothetical protein
MLCQLSLTKAPCLQYSGAKNSGTVDSPYFSDITAARVRSNVLGTTLLLRFYAFTPRLAIFDLTVFRDGQEPGCTDTVEHDTGEGEPESHRDQGGGHRGTKDRTAAPGSHGRARIAARPPQAAVARAGPLGGGPPRRHAGGKCHA